jgi:methylglutaconyl-CoA hydratase
MFLRAAKNNSCTLRRAAAGSRALSSSSGTEFTVEKLGGAHEGVALFSLSRPASRNALGRAMMDEFRSALDAVRFDTGVRVVVVQSTVDRVFCAGADLKERVAMTPPEVGAFVHGLRSAFSGLEALPMPTIAAIEGAAMGGGLELALACDFRVCGSGAVLALPETGLAIIPGAGGTQRLPRLIGMSKAKEMCFTGRRVGHDEALAIGLADRAVDAGGALDAALALAAEMLPKGPVALRMAKQAINAGMQVDITSGMAVEQACYAQVIPTKDRMEGLQAFREKRKPEYTGE